MNPNCKVFCVLNPTRKELNMDLSEETRHAVTQVIAKQILDGLEPSHRDEILGKSICSALKDWKITSAVQEAVSEKATLVAKIMVNEPKFAQAITDAVHNGVLDFLKDLREAVEDGMVKMLVGTKGGAYDTKAGVIFESLDKVRRERSKQ